MVYIHLFQVAAYDKTQMKMAFFDPSRPQDFLFISGTKVKFLPVLLVLSSSQLLTFNLYTLSYRIIADANVGKEQREPARRIHVPRRVESLGRIL